MLVYLMCWLVMAIAGLLYLEACLWIPGQPNLHSLVVRTWGKWGARCTTILYLFLFYSLLITYFMGFAQLWQLMSNTHENIGVILAFCLFTPVVAKGAQWVNRFNSMLMVGLLLSYTIFLLYSIPHLDGTGLSRTNWSLAPWSIPIVLISFGFQGVVPSIVTYLHRDVRKCRIAILAGSALPFLMYAVWEAILLDIVPLDQLLIAAQQGRSALDPLHTIVHITWIQPITLLFGSCALITSLLGVSLSMRDFLLDRCHSTQRTLMAFIVFLPPLLITLYYPSLFLQALGIAGGLGGALLLALLPILIVWKGRQLFPKHTHQVPGGKITLSVVLLFVMIEIVLEMITLNI